MIAVMVANRVDILTIFKILAVKVGSAIICGFLVDGIARLYYKIMELRQKKNEEETEEEKELATV